MKKGKPLEDVAVARLILIKLSFFLAQGSQGQFLMIKCLRDAEN